MDVNDNFKIQLAGADDQHALLTARAVIPQTVVKYIVQSKDDIDIIVNAVSNQIVTAIAEGLRSHVVYSLQKDSLSSSDDLVVEAQLLIKPPQSYLEGQCPHLELDDIILEYLKIQCEETFL